MAAQAENLGKNVAVKTVGNKMTITVDLGKEQGPSKSGKTTVIASTLGNKGIPGHEGVFLGVNVYKYAERK